MEPWAVRNDLDVVVVYYRCRRHGATNAEADFIGQKVQAVRKKE